MRIPFAAGISLLLLPLLPAQNCAGTSIGSVPLMDLGTGSYQGFPGGLYGGGQNTPPPAHDAAGAVAAQAVQPLDAQGNPDPTGRIVLLSIGMSNTTQEFSQFVQISNADPNRAAAVVVVDGAQGGQDARTVANPNAQFWTNVDNRLSNAGVTPQQVQVAWVKEAVARPTAPFPQHAQDLQGYLASIARILKSRYPNVQIAFYSSRIYAGYATTTLNPEPYAYESGHSVKWLIEDQIGGDPMLNFDPNAGPVVAPWLAWGPYLWADGLAPRSDGLVWECGDFVADGTHPSTAGRLKVANLLHDHFTADPFSTPWYVGVGGPVRAAFLPYGSGCPGTGGVPDMRANGVPYVGNLSFRVGVAGAAANRQAILFLGAAQGAVPITGTCVLLVDPAQMFPSITLRTNGSGNAIASIPVPNVAGLIGFSVFGQWAVDDPMGAALPPLAGVAGTVGAEMRVGVR